MRFLGLFLGDLRFGWKYGFYLLYAIISLVYIVVLAFIPVAWKDKAATIIIFSDPSAIGLLFIGAIILLEKSQRVLNSLAISPVKISEYILSKVLALGLVSTIVGLILAIVVGRENLLLVILGTFLGSVVFTLLGLALASNIESINQYIIVIIPALMLIMVPSLFYFFDIGKNYLWFHPGSIVIDLISGKTNNLAIHLAILALWIALFYVLAHRRITNMLKSIGGVKL